MLVWISILGLLAGLLLGSVSPLVVPISYIRYMSVALLACLDTVFGGIRAHFEEKFDNIIFISGFFTNSLLAAGLVYLGDRLGVDLYYAAVIVFGMRLFQNLAIIRRILLKKIYKRG